MSRGWKNVLQFLISSFEVYTLCVLKNFESVKKIYYDKPDEFFLFTKFFRERDLCNLLGKIERQILNRAILEK